MTHAPASTKTISRSVVSPMAPARRSSTRQCPLILTGLAPETTSFQSSQVPRLSKPIDKISQTGALKIEQSSVGSLEEMLTSKLVQVPQPPNIALNTIGTTRIPSFRFQKCRDFICHLVTQKFRCRCHINIRPYNLDFRLQIAKIIVIMEHPLDMGKKLILPTASNKNKFREQNMRHMKLILLRTRLLKSPRQCMAFLTSMISGIKHVTKEWSSRFMDVKERDLELILSRTLYQRRPLRIHHNFLCQSRTGVC